MDLYVIRHADALRLGEHGVKQESDRPLSAKGKKQAVAVGRMLQKRGVQFDQLVTSPYVRAQQTAVHIQRQLQPTPELLTTDALAPEAKPSALAEYLRALPGQCFGLIGHLPHVAEWTGWLIGDKRIQLRFAKAAVAHLLCGKHADKGLGELHWLVTPDWFE